jgi:hypothetical protein
MVKPLGLFSPTGQEVDPAFELYVPAVPAGQFRQEDDPLFGL